MHQLLMTFADMIKARCWVESFSQDLGFGTAELSFFSNLLLARRFGLFKVLLEHATFSNSRGIVPVKLLEERFRSISGKRPS